MSIDSANAADKRKGGFKDSGIVIIEALLLALFINVFLFQPFVIPSGSMRPTLYVGDYVLTAKYAYGYSRYSVPHYLPVSSILPSGRIWSAEPKRGDIVVFRNPSNPNLDFIKRVIGLPVKLLHYGLLCLLAMTIVASLQAVGVILVIAMLIAPGIIAFMLCRRFDRMLMVATIVSVFSCVLGTLISFHIDGATGPCIVIVQAVLFVIALLYSKLRPLQRNQGALTGG